MDYHRLFHNDLSGLWIFQEDFSRRKESFVYSLALQALNLDYLFWYLFVKLWDKILFHNLWVHEIFEKSETLKV